MSRRVQDSVRFAALVLLVLLATSCGTFGPPQNARFCAEVERLGWFDDPLMLSLSNVSGPGGWWSPDPAYPPNDRNSAFRPGSKDTCPCYCYSKKRQEVLAICPSDPWTPRGEQVPEWHAAQLRQVARVVRAYQDAGAPVTNR